MTAHSYTAVREAMTSKPRTIDGLAPVSEALRIMREEGIRCVVIDKRHDHDEYGMLVIHDIALHVIAKGRAPSRVSVYEIMAKPAITVDAEMDIKYAVRLLTRFNLSRALVVEKGEPAGIVTLRDMVLRFVEDDETAEE